MRKTRFTDEQIVGFLTPAADGWRDSQATVSTNRAPCARAIPR